MIQYYNIKNQRSARNILLHRLLLSWLLSLLIAPSAFTQAQINFTAINSNDGLSSNTVNKIIKDKYGLMWFATTDGMNKYDGTNFTVYRNITDDSASLRANEVLALDPASAPADFVRTMLGHVMPEAAGAPTTSWSPPVHGDPRIGQYVGYGVM